MQENNTLWVKKSNGAIVLYSWEPTPYSIPDEQICKLPRSYFPDLIEGESIEVELQIANKVSSKTCFELKLANILEPLAEMLSEKNKAYGNSAFDPVRIFSNVGAKEQLLVRIDDKLSRIARGTEFPGEDTIDDLIGYLIILKMALNEEE